MVTLIIVRNPFDPRSSRDVKSIKYNGTVGKLLPNCPALTGYDRMVSVNGEKADDNTVIKDGDLICVYPVVGKGGKNTGKSIVMLVASIALSAGAMSAGLHVAGGSLSGLGLSQLGGWATAGAIMFVGTSLMGRLFGRVDKGRYNGDNNPTYSWSGIQAMQGQNNPIQLTYGKVRSAGQIIGQYISNNGNDEYLNLLIGAGEGELEFSGVKINNNPASYYKGVKIETRAGTNDQSVISNFNDTYSSVTTNYELTDNEWKTTAVQGNVTEGFIVKLTFPAGLFHINSKGETKDAWVDVRIQYRRNGGSWVDWISKRISASTTSTYRQDFRKDHVSAGSYDIRAMVTGRQYSTTSNDSSSKCVWDETSAITYDDFSYPCLALVGVKALATSQLSGSASVTFLKERKYVWVWNPYSKQYEQKPSNNPAWASYDAIHQARKLINVNTKQYEFEVRGAPVELMRYDDFKNWADWCDQKDFKVNIEINQSGELLDIVNKDIANVGHGAVIQFGTKFGCIFSHKAQPVQMFGMGNIISGTFKEEFLKQSDRANAVEVTFTNADIDYQRDSLTVYSDTYDTDYQEKKTTLTMNGITSWKQAFREGKYQLECNKRQVRTVSFEAGIDSIACTVGDVVLVAHDVPKWTNSGRIYSVSDHTIKLPIEIEDTNHEFIFQYRTVNDNLYTRPCTIVSTGDGWTVITVDSFNADDPPMDGDIFDIAVREKGAKPFVIKAITRTTDFVRAISCLEYDEALFEENYDIPEINYSESQKEPQNVTGLTGKITSYKDETGIYKATIHAEWQAPNNGEKFTILLSDDGGTTFSVVKTQSSLSECDVDCKPDTKYWLKVISTIGIKQSSGVTIALEQGKDDLPPSVDSIKTEFMSSGIRRFWWRFTYPHPNDIAGFKLKYTQGSELNWGTGIPINSGLVTQQPYETQMVRQGTHAVMIKAVDNSGNESENFAYELLNVGNILEENVLWHKDFSENEWKDCDVTGYRDNHNYIRSKNTSMHWKGEETFKWSCRNEPMWKANTLPYYIQSTFTAPASGSFYLKYDIEHPAIVYYMISKKYNFYKDDESTFWQHDNEAFWNTKDDIFVQYSDRVEVKAGDVITVRVEALNSATEETTVKSLDAYIDVPDRTEHFNHLEIPAEGLELPITTPNYETIGCRLDAIEDSKAIMVKFISRTPCKVQLIDKDGNPCSGIADISWQGFIKELLK